MIDRKELILYLVSKVKGSFPREWRHKLEGFNITIVDNGLRLGKSGRKLVGYCVGHKKEIVYYMALFPLFNGSQDIHEYLWQCEARVEHELLHAVGMDEEGIAKWRENQQ